MRLSLVRKDPDDLCFRELLPRIFSCRFVSEARLVGLHVRYCEPSAGRSRSSCGNHASRRTASTAPGNVAAPTRPSPSSGHFDNSWPERARSQPAAPAYPAVRAQGARRGNSRAVFGTQPFSKALGVAHLHKARWRRELPFGRGPGLHHTSATVATTRSPVTKEFSGNGPRYIDLGETLDDINS